MSDDAMSAIEFVERLKISPYVLPELRKIVDLGHAKDNWKMMNREIAEQFLANPDFAKIREAHEAAKKRYYDRLLIRRGPLLRKPKDAIPTSELAMITGIKSKTLIKYVHDKVLKAVNYSGKWFFTLDEVENFKTYLKSQAHLLTSAQAAKIAGVQIQTINKWVRDGLIAPVDRTTRIRLFRPKDIEDIADAKRKAMPMRIRR